jgi:hypothetical protein
MDEFMGYLRFRFFANTSRRHGAGKSIESIPKIHAVMYCGHGLTARGVGFAYYFDWLNCPVGQVFTRYLFILQRFWTKISLRFTD